MPRISRRRRNCDLNPYFQVLIIIFAIICHVTEN